MGGCEGLLYRRQFLLGWERDKVPEGWATIDVAGKFLLSNHPDLNVVHVSSNGMIIYLLGFLVDPLRPTLDDFTLCEELILTGVREEMIRRLEGWGGRFILLVVEERSAWLIGDLTASRPIYYICDGQGRCWCASDPKRLADVLELERDAHTNKFTQGAYFQHAREPWFPGDRTLYRGVRRLLPNHYLELASASPIRYWPRERRKILSLNDGAKYASQLLRGMMRAASHRFPLAFAITGGIDSRTALAALRDCQGDIIFYTGTLSGVIEGNTDVSIPSVMLKQYNMMYNVLDCSKPADESFVEVYNRSVTAARDARLKGIYWTYRQFESEKRVVVLCVISEIAKCFYGSSKDRIVGGSRLARLVDMASDQHATRAFDNWLKKSQEVIQKNDFGLLDLFYWEQRAGSWGATCHVEADLAHETFLPYNCRALMNYMLSVEEKHRHGPTFALHRTMIEMLWPDLLSYPINPLSLKSYIRKRIVKPVVQRFFIRRSLYR